MKCVARKNIIEVFQYVERFKYDTETFEFEGDIPKWIQRAFKHFELRYQGDELWMRHGKRFTRVLEGDFIYVDEEGTLQSMCAKMFKMLYTMYYTKEEAK